MQPWDATMRQAMGLYWRAMQGVSGGDKRIFFSPHLFIKFEGLCQQIP
jgi:hypothetical protein